MQLYAECMQLRAQWAVPHFRLRERVRVKGKGITLPGNVYSLHLLYTLISTLYLTVYLTFYPYTLSEIWVNTYYERVRAHHAFRYKVCAYILYLVTISRSGQVILGC